VKTNEGEMHQEEIEAESGLQGDEDAPRRNIFYSRCTVQNKVPLFPFELYKN